MRAWLAEAFGTFTLVFAGTGAIVINADRGGIDKRCRLVAALRRHGVVVAEATHADLYAAVDEAAGRIRRSVTRAVTRRMLRERKDPQRSGVLVGN